MPILQSQLLEGVFVNQNESYAFRLNDLSVWAADSNGLKSDPSLLLINVNMSCRELSGPELKGIFQVYYPESLLPSLYLHLHEGAP